MEARKMAAPWGSSFTRESFEKLDIGPISLVDRRCSARASFAGKQRVRDEVVIATKFAAYPWRLTPGQFVNACKYIIITFELHVHTTRCSSSTGTGRQIVCLFLLRIKSRASLLLLLGERPGLKYFLLFRGSLDRLQIDKIGVGQLHWSTANYAPLQELALWDGLVAMYEKVISSSPIG